MLEVAYPIATNLGGTGWTELLQLLDRFLELRAAAVAVKPGLTTHEVAADRQLAHTAMTNKYTVID